MNQDCWLELRRGVRVEIPPVTTAVTATAQAAAEIRIADADRGPHMSRGLTFALPIKALARPAVTVWERVGDAACAPLPLSPEAAERPMHRDDSAVAAAGCLRPAHPANSGSGSLHTPRPRISSKPPSIF